MSLPLIFFEKRAERLLKEWDSIEDPLGLPLNEYLRAIKKIDEANLIMMMLDTFKNL